MNQRDMILGGIALAVGLLIGLLFGPSGPDVDDIRNALDERLAAVEAAAARAEESAAALQSQLEEATSTLQTRMDETVSAVESQVAGLADRLSEVETAVGENASAQASMAESLSSELSGRFEALGSAVSAQSDRLQAGIEGFRRSLAMDDVGTQETAAAQAEGEAPAAAASSSAAPEAQTVDEGFVGIGPGQTAIFGNGAMRAFVSRVEPEARVARLSVNGSSAVLAVGEAVGMTTEDGTYCRLMLSGLQGNQVALNGGCGDDLPEPEGVLPGNVMLLADGAVRVFVSGVAEDGNAARIAVNGVDTQSVEVGESVDLTVEDQACQVTLDSIDRGHVALSTDCGA